MLAIRWSTRPGLALELGTSNTQKYARYGLYVNHELSKGNTDRCDTFDNEILTLQKDFIVFELEIWGLDEETLNYLKLIEKK